MADNPNTSANPFKDGGFATTHWSVVMAAGRAFCQAPCIPSQDTSARTRGRTFRRRVQIFLPNLLTGLVSHAIIAFASEGGPEC